MNPAIQRELAQIAKSFHFAAVAIANRDEFTATQLRSASLDNLNLERLRAFLAELEPRARALNVFDFIENAGLEVPHSNMLAALLDPDTDELWRKTFSNSLLRNILSQIEERQHEDAVVLRVQREPMTRGLRRGDILVRYEERGEPAGILIENKTLSEAGLRQPEDLLEGFGNLVRHLVWLTVPGKQPPTGWQHLTYADITECISKALEATWPQATHERVAPDAAVRAEVQGTRSPRLGGPEASFKLVAEMYRNHIELALGRVPRELANEFRALRYVESQSEKVAIESCASYLGRARKGAGDSAYVSWTTVTGHTSWVGRTKDGALSFGFSKLSTREVDRLEEDGWTRRGKSEVAIAILDWEAWQGVEPELVRERFEVSWKALERVLLNEARRRGVEPIGANQSTRNKGTR